MSLTTTDTVLQRGPVTNKADHEDALKNKIIEHFCQLTLDPDFKNASATYSQVKEQQEQIRTRDEKLTSLQKDIEAQKERESVMFSRFSAANQDLAIQKEIAEKRIVSLQKENTEKDKSLTEISRRIQELQRQLQTLLSERSQDERKMRSMIAQHNLEIDSFQTRLKKRDASVDKLKETDTKLTSLLAEARAKIGCFEQDKKSLDEKLLQARSRLEKFDSFILEHRQIDEQSIIDGFSGLWGFAASEIWTVLGQNLNEDSLRIDGPWNKFRLETDAAIRDGAILRQPVPLCASNSDAAKGMRLAVMLSILSRQIDKEIFQPSYFPSETGYFRLSLNRLVKSDSEKEHFYRSVLLSIDRDGQEAELRSRAKSIVQNVSHYLYELLSTTQYGELKERIKNVIDRAIEVWRPIQNSTKKYETEFDPADWAPDEDFLFQFPIGGEDSIGAEHQKDQFLVIFPGLQCLESDAFILTSVVPLTGSQKLYIAANRELGEEFRGKASPTTKQPSRKRQNSVAKPQLPSNGTNFLGRHSSGGSGN